MMFKRFKKLIFAFILALLCTCSFAQSNFRGVENQPVNINAPWENDDSYNYNDSMVVKNALRDNNQKLYAVVGKSQILNFDTPVKRIKTTNG